MTHGTGHGEVHYNVLVTGDDGMIELDIVESGGFRGSGNDDGGGEGEEDDFAADYRPTVLR